MKNVSTVGPLPSDRYLSVKRVAERLDTSPATIWRWTAAGTFVTPSKFSPGMTRWKLSEIEAWEMGRSNP